MGEERGSLQGVKPGHHVVCYNTRSPKSGKGEFSEKDIPAELDRGINTLESPVVPCNPNTPRLNDDDFHKQGDLELVFDVLQYFQGVSCCDVPNTNTSPASFGEVTSGEQMPNSFSLL